MTTFFLLLFLASSFFHFYIYSWYNSLQYSCLENLMDRGTWHAAARGVTELDMTYHLNTNTHIPCENHCCMY